MAGDGTMSLIGNMGLIALLDPGDERVRKRRDTCYSCVLYSMRGGGRCNSRLWLDPDTGDVRTSPAEGYVNGCNCLVRDKTLDEDASCPAGKW